jgi:hypothetical protein
MVQNLPNVIISIMKQCNKEQRRARYLGLPLAFEFVKDWEQDTWVSCLGFIKDWPLLEREM